VLSSFYQNIGDKIMIEFSNYSYSELECIARVELGNREKLVDDLKRQLAIAQESLEIQQTRHDFIYSILVKREKNNLSRRDFIPQPIVDKYNHHIY
jgi:hypothetical protein